MTSDQLTLFAGEPPASRSPSRDYVRGLLTRGAISPSPSLQSLIDTGLDGFFGRTSLAFCPPMEDGTLAPSSEGWGSWGTGGATGCWTRNMSEWTAMSGPSRSDDGVCGLSDVLETGGVPLRYFLSPRACSGILRRAERRGKQLPRQLQAALTAVAQTGRDEAPTTQTA